MTPLIKRPVDAAVLQWLGGTDHQGGSRHMLNVKKIGSPTGSQAWHDLNMFNHARAEEGMNSDKFEEHRMSYCAFLMSTEDKVEDAITGNHL